MIPEPAVNIWAHTKSSLYPLYEKRAAGQAEEMDCHVQAAEIYRPHYKPEYRVLDAGGGSGYFYWSLARRSLLGDYYLLDYTEDFVEMARRHLGGLLAPERFMWSSIEETPGVYDIVFCLNTLFCLPDYRQGLERLLAAAGEMLILRSTFADKTQIRYETDDFLDPEARGLKSYFNIWPMDEVAGFMRGCGFEVTTVLDQRTGDKPEISAGKPFPWRWLIARRLG